MSDENKTEGTELDQLRDEMRRMRDEARRFRDEAARMKAEIARERQELASQLATLDAQGGQWNDYLEIRGLHVEFDGFVAVKDIDLTVMHGDLRFLIGPNGAGKTTIIDAITGLVPATGSAMFGGEELIGRKPNGIVRLGGRPHLPDGLRRGGSVRAAESATRRRPAQEDVGIIQKNRGSVAQHPEHHGSVRSRRRCG